MALNNMGLGFVFTARDLASAKFDRLTGRFNALDSTTAAGAARMTATLGTLKKAFAGFAIGAASLFAAFSIAGPAGEFEQELSRVGAISRATADDMRVLESAATDAGLATQFSPVEAARGLGVLASQGFNAVESAKALIPALDLAAGGSIAVADSSQAMSAALKVFGLEVDQATMAADKLLRITNLTALQAHDLSLVLGTVGRGASATKQSIDEMLPSIGLVKNTGVDASVAASSVSSALLMMAKNADKFGKVGVKVTDAQGKFRPFLDVVLETQGALAGYTDEAEKTAKVTELFGRFGVTAFSAITAQVGAGIKNARGDILTGRDAVESLRQSMRDSGGAAKSFRDQLVQTFAGQKRILGGIFETLTIEMGKPFAAVLAPIVSGLARLLEGLIRVIQAIPKPVKNFMAGLLVAGSVITMVVAGAVAMKAAFALLAPIVAAVAASLAPFVVIGLKVAAVAGAIAGAVIGLGNVLGINGRTFTRIFDSIRLGWQALGQLFEQGGLSGAIQKDLAKAENAGLKRFVIQLFRIGARVRSFFVGIGEGFDRALGPAVDVLLDAGETLRRELSALASEVGGAFGGMTEAFADILPLTGQFKTGGEAVGAVLGLIARGLVGAITVGVRFASTIVSIVRDVRGFVGEVGAQFRRFGEGVASAFGWARDMAVGAFTSIRDAAVSLVSPIASIFQRMADGVSDAIGTLQDSVIEAVRALPDWALPEGLEDMRATLTTEERRRQVVSAQAFEALPAAAQETARRASTTDAGFGDMAGAIQALVAQLAAQAQAGPGVVQLDGQRVGQIIRNGERDAALREFTPVRVVP